MAEPHHRIGLLDGVRVLDLSIWRPGPYATQLLAEAGADVLKVEPPGGDPMRQYPELFARVNVNKRSIVLDLKDQEGRARLAALAVGADVVVEGFRPGVAARLGAGYDELSAVNRKIVYCSVSGLGQVGPLAPVPGHDVNYQAWSGLLAPGGGRPHEQSVPLADLAAGLAAAFAICAALARRDDRDDGERIDVSMTDLLATWVGVTAPSGGPEAEAPRGNVVPGYGTFETADGRYLSLGVVSEDHFWEALCRSLGLDDHAGLGFTDRQAQGTALQAEVAAAVGRGNRDALVAMLAGAGVPVAPVLSRREIASLPHFLARGTVVDDADGPSVGYPLRFERHPAARTSPAPALDQHAGMDWLPRG
jgi:crotonobetainyl-CoA:carnitine CoA-transferase CaiB-like acyl-CoA transferase